MSKNTYSEDSRPNIILKEEGKDDMGYPSELNKSYHREAMTYQSEMSNAGSKGGRKKNKRRSKKDQEGRNFRCQHCEKTYLSYPALYTHKKLKHPDVKVSETIQRKVVKRTEPYDSEKNPTSLEYFCTPDKAGGPIDPLSYFYEITWEKLKLDPKRSRMYPFLKVFSILDGFAVEDPETLIPKRDYDDLSPEEKKSKMCCDEVLALYLREVSRITNTRCYRKVMTIVILYRE
mmetsp:Transcript_833/g.817  ORF Transcript_833/g.817 Transcript_833/m.817 type:complete len:232 (+) Transcript_833:5-700(+)